MNNFSRDQTRVLIACYRQYSDLHDVHGELYKNKANRTMMLNELTQDIRNALCNQDITTDEVRKKIGNLRAHYYNELAKIKKSREHGPPQKVFKPSWWCFDDLDFLRHNAPSAAKPFYRFDFTDLDAENGTNHSSSRSGIFNSPDKEDTNVVTSDSESSVSSLPPSPNRSEAPTRVTSTGQVSKKRARITSPTSSKGRKESLALIKVGTDLLQGCIALQANQTDPIDAFGRLVAAELRAVKNKRTLNRLRRMILNLIYDAITEEENII